MLTKTGKCGVTGVSLFIGRRCIIPVSGLLTVIEHIVIYLCCANVDQI